MVPKQPMIFQSGLPSKRSSDNIFVRGGNLTRIAERSRLLGWSEQLTVRVGPSLAPREFRYPNIALDEC